MLHDALIHMGELEAKEEAGSPYKVVVLEHLLLGIQIAVSN